MFRHPVTDAHMNHVRNAYAYQDMPDDRLSASVQASYSAFKAVILEQWRTLLPVLSFEAWTSGADSAYSDSAAMRADVRERWHLYVFPTTPSQMDDTHPLWDALPYWDRRPGLTHYNDAFRAVHDVLGHVASGGSFGVNGEARAWLAHRETMTWNALPALWCETRGQAAWTNAYRDHAQRPLSLRPFAIQKAGMPPLELV